MQEGDILIALKDDENRFITKGKKYKITKMYTDNHIDLRSLNGLIYTGISKDDFDEYFEKLPTRCKFRKNDILIDEETKDILLITHVDFADRVGVLKIDITMKALCDCIPEFINKNYKKLKYKNLKEETCK